MREHEVRAKEKLINHWSVKVEHSQLNYLEKLEREKRRVEAEALSISTLE